MRWMAVVVTAVGCKSAASRVAEPTPLAELHKGQHCDQRVAVDGYVELSTASVVYGGRVRFSLLNAREEATQGIRVHATVGPGPNEVQAPPDPRNTLKPIALTDHTGVVISPLTHVRISGQVECDTSKQPVLTELGGPAADVTVSIAPPLVIDPLE